MASGRQRAACFTLVLLAVGSVQVGHAAGWTVTPTFSATQLITDNRDLTENDKRSEAITVLSPGLSVSRNSGRVTASLAYTLNGQIYARDSDDNTISNALSAALNAELVENHAFLAATAGISQQSISAFNLQGNRPNGINPNATEVRTLSVSPSLRGRLLGDIEARAQLTSSISSSADDAASDSVSHNAALSIGESVGRLGWSVSATRSISDFDGGRKTTRDAITGQVSYAPEPGLRFFVNAGTESGDVLSEDQRDSDVWGGGVSWQPTPRTQLGLQGQRRYFGDSYALTASHRFRRAAITYTDSRNSSDTLSDTRFALSAYELFFLQFASVEPDPVRRDQLVRDFLRAAGLDPDERIGGGGALFRAVNLQQTRALSLSWQGVRTTAVASAFYTNTRRLDTISDAEDDLSQVSELRQEGFSASVSHRLTPVTSMVLSASYSRTPSVDGVEGNSLRSVSLSWTHALGARTAVSASARQAVAKGPNPYTENSLSAQLNVRF